MPSLASDPSGFYFIALRFLGRRYRRSLKTRDRREAERLVARIEDNLRLIERGRIEVPDGIDVPSFLLSDCRIAGPPSTQGTLNSLSQLFDSYFERMGVDRLEKSTLQGMRIHRAHLERLMGKQRNLASLNADVLQRYIDDRSGDKVRGKQPISPATIKKEIVTLRTVVNWAFHLSLVSKPFHGTKLSFPKTEGKLAFRTLGEAEERIARGGITEQYATQIWASVFLSLEELTELLSYVRSQAQEPYAYFLFAFAAHTGARRSEMLRSEIDDFDLRSGAVTIRERKRVRGARSTRTVPMSSTLVAALKAWLCEHPGGPYTFPGLVIPPQAGEIRNDILLRVDKAHDLFQRTLKSSRWRNLTGYHALRHSFCSNLAASGVDQRVIDAFVGHLSLETQRRYRHLLPSQARHSIDSVFG